MSYNAVVIGCGNIAGGYDDAAGATDLPLSHAGALKRSEKIALLACIDPDRSKRDAFKHKWGAEFGFDDPSEVDPTKLQIDVVSICSPTALREDHLNTVLDWAPKLVFCEKPIAPRFEDARYWVNKFSEANIPFLVNYSRRWDPDVIALKSELDSGKLGKVRSVSCFYNKGLLHNGGHMIDTLLFLFGELTLISTGRKIFDFWDKDPSVPALLETQSDVPVSLNVGHAKDFALFELQIVTEQGFIRMVDGGLNWEKSVTVSSSSFAGVKTLSAPDRRAGRYPETMTLAYKMIEEMLSGQSVEMSSTGYTALETHATCEKIMAQAD